MSVFLHCLKPYIYAIAMVSVVTTITTTIAIVTTLIIFLLIMIIASSLHQGDIQFIS